MLVERAKRFAKVARLGVITHGTLILGLPGETRETTRKPSAAIGINPHPAGFTGGASRHVLQAAQENNWFAHENADMLSDRGVQLASLSYPHLSHTEIFQSVDAFYRRFYFRAPKIAAIAGEMVRSPDILKRRLREGIEFFRFLRERREPAL
jgi:hypothetical protein